MKKCADHMLRRVRPRERFLYLSDGIDHFESLGTVVSFAKNKILLEPTQIPDCCYAVKTGRVVSYEFTVSGDERIYHIMEPGALVLDASLLTGTPPRVYYKMLTAGSLIRIERESFLNAILQNSAICLSVMESLSKKFLSSMQLIREKNNLDAAKKIGSLLFSMAEYQGEVNDNGLQMREKISKQMIANLLGINRVTTVRMLTALKEQKLVDCVDDRFTIRDPDKLRAFLK